MACAREAVVIVYDNEKVRSMLYPKKKIVKRTERGT